MKIIDLKIFENIEIPMTEERIKSMEARQLIRESLLKQGINIGVDLTDKIAKAKKKIRK